VRTSGAARSVTLLVLLLTPSIACGKKGPPLAPLRLVPAAVSDASARRTGQEVELRFALPTTNANGPGDIDLDRIEIYAITIGPGAVTPPNRDLLTKARVVGTIAVRPPPVEGEGEDRTQGAAADKRPAPGDRVTFVEELTEEKLKPVPGGQGPGAGGQAEPPSSSRASTPPAQNPETPVPGPRSPVPDTTTPTRIYAIRGLSRAGRPGLPSTRVSVPLLSPVAPPSSVAAGMPTERAIVVDWTPPVAEPGSLPLTFNVYRREALGAPLNQAPLSAITFELASIEYGKEECFVVRTVQDVQNVTIESDPSTPACLTPLDTFPPVAPKGLRAVAEPGAVNLVWDPNSEPDLGGYLVLRAEAPGDTLQPLTPKPIKDANFRDTEVKPGVRYVYAVVAVDTATPVNPSAPSAREEATAR